MANVLVDSIPDVPDREGAMRALARKISMPDDAFRKKPLHLRLEWLERLQEIYVPFEHSATALARILALVRWSYAHRNPEDPEVQRFIYEAASADSMVRLPRRSQGGGGAIGLCLAGVTGAGKTSFLDRLTTHLGPPVIEHHSLGGRSCRWLQVPMIRVQCPARAALDVFARDVFAQIDSVAGTRHCRYSRRMSISQLMLKMTSVCSLHFLGALVVDDVQLLRGFRGDPRELLGHICNFMEMTGIPVVLVGTYGLLSVLDAQPTFAGKLAAKGVVDFAPFRQTDDEFVLLIEVLWGQSILEHPGPMPPLLPILVWRYTGGVPRLIRMAMAALHERMAKDESGSIDAEQHLKHIAANELLFFQGAVDALKRLDAGGLTRSAAAEYEDFIPVPRVPKRIDRHA